MHITKVLGALLPVAVALATGVEAVEAQANPEVFRNRMAAPSQMIRVSVENHNWTKVRVYVAVNGGYVAIGTAQRMCLTTFSIPAGLLAGRSSLHLLAHPVNESDNTVVGHVRLDGDGSVSWAITGMVVKRVRVIRV